jgi:transposase
VSISPTHANENDSHFPKIPENREPFLGFARSERMSQREAELERDNAQQAATIVELRDLVASLRAELEQKELTIHRLVKMTFGRSTERHVGPTLFDAIEPPEVVEVPPPTPDDLEIPAQNPRRRGHGRRRLPTNLPVERVEIDLPDDEKPCPCCGKLRVPIGFSDPTRRLDFRPARLFIHETTRAVYACRDCEQAAENPQIEKASLPPVLTLPPRAAPGLLAHIIVSKFCDHLPLYRQECMFERDGFVIPRSTLCDWLMECAAMLTPLYRAMRRRILQSHSIHADETTLQLLQPRRSGYAWVYIGDDAHPFTLFDITVGRVKEHPATFLADFKGFLHCDGYDGYNLVHANVRHVGCWMHVRRDFFDVRKIDVRATEALAFIHRLYAIEREAKDHNITGEALTRHRQLHAKPVLAKFATWLMEMQRTALPTSGFGKAVGYAINQWASLIRYADDSRLDIDNGVAERAIRPLAIGRRNWLFLGGDGGMPAAGVLLSLVASAKQAKQNPWLYLRDVLTRLPARPPNSDVSDLLPDRWQLSAT